MKILFLLKEPYMFDRMGVMCLAGALKEKGHHVLMHYAHTKVHIQNIFRIMKEEKPGILAYSVMTGEYERLRHLNCLLKNHHDFLGVFGGPHPSFFPEMLQDKGVDAICLGEGDISFPEFVNRVEAGTKYWKTPGFHVKHHGRIWKNPLSPLPVHLDELPFPDRETLYRMDPEMAEDGVKFFTAQRGCPYRCTYCMNETMREMYPGQPYVRIRSPENLVLEMEAVQKRYPVKTVFIYDDTFLTKPFSWFREFAQIYPKRIGLPFVCHVRADLVQGEIMEMLRKAGLHAVLMGIECGREEVGNHLLHRNLTNREIIQAAGIMKKNGIRLVTQNMTGMPVENPFETDLSTLDLNIRIQPDFAMASLLYPYPGTWIRVYAGENGYLPENQAGFAESNKRSSVFAYADPTEKNKVENLHKLFGLIVRFPFLRPYAGLLCRLGPKQMYGILFYLFYGYSMKMKIMPMEKPVKEIPKYLRLMLRQIKKS